MRVPQFNQQVSEGQIPNVRISGGVSPGEAVHTVSNQLDGAVGFVNAASDVFDQYREQADRVRVIDAQNKLTELRLHLQNNDIDGYSRKKGSDVVGFDDGHGAGFVDYYKRAYEDGIGEIANRLGNDRQRALFKGFVDKDSLDFQNNLQKYFINENDSYQQSVYSASADRYIMNINEDPLNFEKLDENRQNTLSSYIELARIQGKSATEAENNYLKTMSAAHIKNLNGFVENGNLQSALLYKQKYKGEISLNDAYKIDQKIKQKVEDQQVEAMVNSVTTGTQYASNPALNAPIEASTAIANELKSLSPDQMKNIKYNDQRLDVYTVHSAKEKGMEWAVPLLLGIRLSGEKSNNNAISEKGARSVMQFIPSTWQGYSKDKKTGKYRDINNPADVIDAAFDFISDISQQFNTRDPRVLAAYYHGGVEDAKRVQAGGTSQGPRGRAYVERIQAWINSGFGSYANKPAKTREQAYDEIWNSNAPLEVKQKALSASEQYFSGQDKVKKDNQDQIYDQYYRGLATGRFTYEQIPAVDIQRLEPNQISSLRSFSKSLHTEIKTDPTVLSMITLNQEQLFKDKPQSVVHQYADKLSATDYKNVTQMYIDVNKPPKEKDEKKFLIDDNTVSAALKPYLNIIGVTDTKDKAQLLHFNAVKSDLIQTLREAEAKNGSHLTWEQVNRVVLKNVNWNIKTTTTGIFSNSSEVNRLYVGVKSKKDIPNVNLEKINKIFKDQGRNLSNVTDAEYINAYYSMMRRGF